PAVKGDALKERFGARAGRDEPIFAAVLTRATLLGGEGAEVARVLDLASLLPRALMTGDLLVAVEHADDGVRGDERQRLAYERVRDRVGVPVEADVRRLAARDGLHVVAGHRVCGQREQALLLLGERDSHRALVDVPGHDARVRDPLDPFDQLT